MGAHVLFKRLSMNLLLNSRVALLVLIKLRGTFARKTFMQKPPTFSMHSLVCIGFNQKTKWTGMMSEELSS